MYVVGKVRLCVYVRMYACMYVCLFVAKYNMRMTALWKCVFRRQGTFMCVRTRVCLLCVCMAICGEVKDVI